MSARATGTVLLTAATAVGACFWVAALRPQRWPDRAWILGPSAERLAAAARAEVEVARAVLRDEGRPIETRLGDYRERLRVADALYVRSLRANPARAGALADLAIVRWELAPPAPDADAGEHLARIEAASRLAPGVPGVQLRLGDLLNRMGRTSEAEPYLRRAVELEPAMADDVLDTVRPYYPDPAAMLAALPHLPEVLVALAPLFREARPADPFLDAVERAGMGSDARLVRIYGEVALASGGAARLLERTGELEADGAVEAERLLQRARALAALGRAREALDDASEALRLAPNDQRFAVTFARLALAAGRPDEALTALRDALARAARAGAPAGMRARLYSEIGRAEEAAGRPARAYDLYRKALSLDPEQGVARRRVSEMEARSR